MSGGDPLDIARRDFGVARKGYDQQEVRAFLHEVQALVDRLRRGEQELGEKLREAERRAEAAEHPDEAMLLEVLGEETTRVLTSAREAAAAVHAKAEETAAKAVEEATREAARIRGEAVDELEQRKRELEDEVAARLAEGEADLARRAAEAEEVGNRIRAEAEAYATSVRTEADGERARARDEAEAEREAARQKGKEMVAEAQAVRERVLKDLAAKRRRARLQLEKLNAGRERLLRAYEIVRATIDDATNELSNAVVEARIAADQAARRVEAEAEPSLEALDAEVSTAALVDLPVARTEVAVDAEPEAAAPEADVADRPEPEPEAEAAAPATGVAGQPEPEAEAPAPAAEVADLSAPEPEAQAPVPEAEVADPEGGPEPEAVEAPQPGSPAAEVKDLFDRLRAEQASADEPEVEAAAIEAAPTEAAGPAADTAATAALTARDEALEPVARGLSKRLKRVLADEQNEVLDALRRSRTIDHEVVLPSEDAHAKRWADAAAPALDEAAAAGAAWAGGGAAGAGDLAGELARSLVEPLRDRITRSFQAAEGDLDDAADRVRALYREWKGQRLDDAARHHAVAAYAGGVLAAVPAGAAVRWIVDTGGDPCPDAEDNALAGSVPAGEGFPTGDRCPPAHPGCRCLVIPAGD